MSYSQKPQKTSYSKSKGFDQDRWDHSGYDKLQQEVDDRTSQDGKGNKTKKGKKGTPDSTLPADQLETANVSSTGGSSSKKWTHVSNLGISKNLSIRIYWYQVDWTGYFEFAP